MNPDPLGPEPATPAARARRSRRQWLLAAGVALTAGGAGLAWRGWHDRAASAPDTPPWPLVFPRPEGGELRMAALWGRPLVLNFWATWCPPCIEELPELERFHRAWSSRGWQVVGLAVDAPTPVREFLTRQPLSFPIGLAGLDGSALSRTLGNERGALPFTAVFDGAGRMVQRKLGQTSFDELAAWAAGI
jgi:thiol-disulfide isomerase/thioredoxin